MPHLHHKTQCLLALWLLLLPLQISDTFPVNELKIWNVGQGQWVTWLFNDHCFHFDVGGEKPPPIKKLVNLCQNKKNQIFISHYDWDHMSFLTQISRWLPHSCLDIKNSFRIKNTKKSRLIKRLPLCQSKPSDILELQIPSYNKFKKWSENYYSRVFILQKKVLISGDSPIHLEKKWLIQIREPSQIKYFILGHHGSRTSNSEVLLKSLTQLKMSFSSSRFKKYRHPHPVVRERLNKLKIPLLETEKWNHITLQF